MRIYLIRHGETDWNRLCRLQGREDVPLNEQGKKQAKRCGKAFHGIALNKIITSPLKRAKETAKIIGEQNGIFDLVVEPDLIERDFGEASGMTYEEKNQRYGTDNIIGFEAEDVLFQRMKDVMLKYDRELEAEDVLMVSHGAAIKVLLKHIISKENRNAIERLKNACINVIEVKKDRIQLVDCNLDPEEFRQKYTSN